MSKKIKNVGLLNLLQATKESVSQIDHIENVGLMLYSKQTAHLVSMLSIGNLGDAVCTENETKIITGQLTVTDAFLMQARSPQDIIVQGTLVFSKDVTKEALQQAKCRFIVTGFIYTTDELKGAIYSVILKQTGTTEVYSGKEPFLKNGAVELNTATLQSFEDRTNLVVNGMLSISPSLDLALFEQKIESMFTNGMIELYEDQQSVIFKNSSVNGKARIIPTGYQSLNKTKVFHNRNIRRYHDQMISTNKPIILKADITRETFSKAFQSIDSSSYLICSEELEDLVYERLNQIETDVFVYEDELRYVENEEWTEQDLESLATNTVIVIAEKLVIKTSLSEALVNNGHRIFLFGELYVPDTHSKTILQSVIEENKGIILDSSISQVRDGHSNYGTLVL